MNKLEERVKSNEELISLYTLEELIDILKQICIACISLPTEKETEAITNADSYNVKYEEGKLRNLTVYTNVLEYKNFKMELNSLYITISKQNGHTAFEKVTFIPIEVFKLLN